jgi:GT2 family glycosyltransferase/glycosyltransferase involved in cell wall biosynthesis
MDIMAERADESAADSDPDRLEVRGYIDTFDGCVLTGWAASTRNPDERLRLQVRYRGRLVAEGIADVYRKDLEAAGLGDGHHAFDITLPADACGASVTAIDVSEVTTATKLVPVERLVEAANRTMLLNPADLSAARVHGYVDAYEAGVLKGWAASNETPGKILRMQVRLKGELLAEGLADHYRDDLRRAGFGDGRHGFELPLPADFLRQDFASLEVLDAESATRIEQLSTLRSPTEKDNLHLLFDAGYYERQGGPIDDGLAHYQSDGWRCGLDPHPLFSTEHYLCHCGDLSGLDPLTHFIWTGGHTHHSTHPLFDVTFYFLTHPDALPTVHPLLDYLNSGFRSGAAPSPFFSETFYAAQCRQRDITLIGPALCHYLTHGRELGLLPHPEFEPALFARLANVPEWAEPYTHFVSSIRNPLNRDVRPSVEPTVSIIILNHNKAVTTLQCLYFLALYTEFHTAEVIVVDNGSDDVDFHFLAKYSRGTEIIRLQMNRGFGEGNNIGAERARGDYLVFLNNDSFVRQGWLDPLVTALTDNPHVAAAGAKLLFPSGSLQEAGASISACGTALQRGKYLNPREPAFNRTGPADYCSAAALIVRAQAFREVLGFDLCWHPAYYEDADLCLKFRLLGQQTVYAPDSEVVHLEHTTSSDVSLGLGLDRSIDVNRSKFVARWHAFLDSGDETSVRGLLPGNRATRPCSGLLKLALFTPYPLYPGGGERYLLSIAAALQERFRCTLVTPERYSVSRIRTVLRELDISLGEVEPVSLDDACRAAPFDLFVAMGNHVFPEVPALGRRSIFHCQFPFPCSAEETGRLWSNLNGYDAAIVNSNFTAGHLRQAANRLGLTLPAIDVLHPPVPQIGEARDGAVSNSPNTVILNVGRFAPFGHAKGQHVLIAEFRRLLRATGLPLELNMAGAVDENEEGREYFWQLTQSAHDIPVFFHPNVMANDLADLYRRATIYWHATGAGEDVRVRPERFEHFGIALVEAISAGAVAVAIRYGGPEEIIEDGVNGLLISDGTQFSACTQRLLESADIERLARSARERAATFSFEHFAQRLAEIVSSIEARSYSAMWRSK